MKFALMTKKELAAHYRAFGKHVTLADPQPAAILLKQIAGYIKTPIAIRIDLGSNEVWGETFTDGNIFLMFGSNEHLRTAPLGIILPVLVHELQHAKQFEISSTLVLDYIEPDAWLTGAENAARWGVINEYSRRFEDTLQQVQGRIKEQPYWGWDQPNFKEIIVQIRHAISREK